MTLHPRRRRVRSAALVALVMLLAVTGCVDGREPSRQIRIATGSPTAVYYAVGTAFAHVIEQELPGTDASVLSTAASAENVQLINRGAAEIGFTQADVLIIEDQSVTGLVALARVYDDLLHLVVPADSPIRTLTDLRGKRVSVGARGSGTVVTVGRLLTVAGLFGPGVLDRRELSLDDSVRALNSGEIDAFFFSGGLPVAGIQQLTKLGAFRIVDLSRWAADMRSRYSDVYVVRDVPTSAYQMPAVATIAVPNLLVVSAEMDDDLAYDLTRLLLERRDALAAAHPAAERLDLRAAIATLPVPLHTGAARYYRSVKP
ncbi:TAXI family TRAP transporter solute-binding subunit [Paractinoplanes rishiriensis]|uniref:C4-dicarboxylate ABC transporter substrate-binding protein n=1 Tax=Paractinoplanes rishiriensis TaxID=1050105 RepID=A0A919JVM1_9ACTN|nr:TAXI family TRAP transporter solute-binding subunit [Actinoplanes rishiriensis]GIE95668.1 C4-dicarboxylate ABC transporter substrate-binding protein [Actinoplanes rishiriensis]